MDGEKNVLKQKHKEQAGIIVKTLDAQISKRQQYVNAERKRKEDHEKKINEDNKEYLETRKSVQKEWKEKAKKAGEEDRERHRLYSSMKVPL